MKITAALLALALLPSCNLISQVLAPPYSVTVTAEVPPFLFKGTADTAWTTVPDVALTGKVNLLGSDGSVKTSVNWQGGLPLKIPTGGGSYQAELVVTSGSLAASGQAPVEVSGDAFVVVRATPVLKRVVIVPPVSGVVTSNTTTNLEYWAIGPVYRIGTTPGWYTTSSRVISGDATIIASDEKVVRVKFGAPGKVTLEVGVNTGQSEVKSTLTLTVEAPAAPAAAK